MGPHVPTIFLLFLKSGKLLFIYCFAHDGPYPHVCPRPPLFLQEQSDSEVEAEEAVLWSRQYTAGDYSAIKCKGEFFSKNSRSLALFLIFFISLCLNLIPNVQNTFLLMIQSSLIECILRECVMLLHSDWQLEYFFNL